mmetsp:Transcript_31348/g.57510  ORF Transcript_31348/g.57510 Transcript_31348/m.57510 type:complete len:220 (-) Transcript_31348:35-694(-)
MAHDEGSPRLPDAVLALLREAEAEDDATIDFIREAVLGCEGPREDQLEEIADLLEQFRDREETKELAVTLLDWAEEQRKPSKEQKDSAAAAAQTVQQLIAADAAAAALDARASASTATEAAASGASEKDAILRAARVYEQVDGTGGGEEPEVMNANRQAQMEHRKAEAAQRAAMSAAHAAKVAKDKADTAAAKAKRQEAKKKAQERSKANESRRGGRGM